MKIDAKTFLKKSFCTSKNFEKEEYIFVDIFDRISFDLQAGNGRAIATMLNGRFAQFSEELNEGDKIELYWEEK